MHGFKSFAEPVSIEFNHGITCIVGPNGSGKSNISDAIRWVLGEQSPKTLRGGKMEDVIFAGTASRKSRGMAEVVLVIDNSTGILPIDYSEVAITRRVFRSGESEYFINNNQCRLKDIRELIMDTGIGVDGYSLIGQGKIADMVSTKAESRREIFEEAAGIVKYRSKKAEAERKLEATRGNLDRVNDIVSEIEGRIGDLKEDSEKAREYLELKEKYQGLEINITLKNIENLELKNEYLKDDISELAYKIDNLKDERAELEESMRQVSERNQELAQLNAQGREKLLKLIDEINLLVNEGKLKEEKLASLDREEVRLKQELAGFAEKKEKEEANLTEILKSKDELHQMLKELSEHLSEKQEIHEKLLCEKNKLADENEDAKNNMYTLHTQIGGKKGEISSLENLKGTLERRRSQLSEEKNQEGSVNREALKKHQEGQAQVSELEEKLKAAQRALGEERNGYQEKAERRGKLDKDLQELGLSIGQLTSRMKTIQEMESNYEGYNYAVKFVMKRGFKGVRGVVGDLIQVPKGFEVAMETALGAAMQNIVCGSDSEAQDIIRALKENKAGRLTLLPVESVHGSAYDGGSLAGEPGFKGIGCNCVEYEPSLKGVMEYLLGRVVVCDTLKNAVRLSKKAKGGLRFVTLEGEVINSGGAITGGSFKNKTANLLERKNEVTALEEKIGELSKKRQELLDELQDIKAYLAEGESRIREGEESCRKQEMSLMTLRSQLEVMEGSLKDLSERDMRREKELLSIEDEMKSADEMIEKLQNEIEQAKGKIQEYQHFIEDSTGKLALMEREGEEKSQEITEARIQVTSCEKDAKAADDLVERIGGLISEIDDDMEVRNLQLSKLYEDRKTLSEAGNLQGSSAEKEEERKNLENYLSEIEEEMGSINSKIKEDTAARNKLEEELSASQNQKYELEIKEARNETQLDTYKNKLWDEFEVSYLQAIEFKKKDFNMNEAVKEARGLRSRIKALGDVNVGSIKEYDTVSERYEFLTSQRKDILSAMDSLKQIIEDMDRTIKAKFKESFDLIVENFEKVFQELFGGGHAVLSLEDETRPLDCGIEIVAQPPGKKLQNINLMSGGEKTMTAIALMFAVLKAKPTPFCILDEVEAALDDANIDRFASYLQNFKDIQFALVTHQKATMEHADVLYGVTMPEQGISRVLSLKLGDKIDLD